MSKTTRRGLLAGAGPSGLSRTWPYHDHAMAMPLPAVHSEGGMMVGPQMELGCRARFVRDVRHHRPRTPRVDREFILFFHDMYGDDLPPFDRDWDCFNGFAYLGNTPTFRARVGDRVRWRVAALGTEFHVFHVHGHRWRAADRSYLDAAGLGPSTTRTVEWTEDSRGKWLYHVTWSTT
jgi:manganese oxidase